MFIMFWICMAIAFTILVSREIYCVECTPYMSKFPYISKLLLIIAYVLIVVSSFWQLIDFFER